MHQVDWKSRIGLQSSFLAVVRSSIKFVRVRTNDSIAFTLPFSGASTGALVNVSPVVRSFPGTQKTLYWYLTIRIQIHCMCEISYPAQRSPEEPDFLPAHPRFQDD